MGFLTPLYLMAALAVGLPVAFHLIRRTPQGKQMFGSIMFLSPSPPRMSRRRKIEDWLLLLLRGLAVCLLALAFARPFFKTAARGSEEPQERIEMTILLDRSASMQQPGAWDRAIQSAHRTLQQLGSEDSCEVAAFDTDLEIIMPRDEWMSLAPETRQQVCQDHLRQLSPGWDGTATAHVLRQAAEEFQANTVEAKRQIVLISDVSAGGGWDGLEEITWPENLTLAIENVTDVVLSNAALQPVENRNERGLQQRVRITNSPTSSTESLQLFWRDPFAASPEVPSATVQTQALVPAGQSRVVLAPEPPPGLPAHVLELSGDEITFDNFCYVLPQSIREVRIAFLGKETATAASPDSLRFFLSPMFPSDDSRQVTIIDWPQGTPSQDLLDTRPDWVIVGGKLDEPQLAWLSNWMASGGMPLFVTTASTQATDLARLLPEGTAQAWNEAQLDNYAMLGRVDYYHPALQPFRDPRFSDFTKLRFWKYREFDVANRSEWRTLAAYENGLPALAEFAAPQSRLLLLTSGWNRDDSDLAVWSKFVPLMNSLLDYAAPPKRPPLQFTVGATLKLDSLGLTGDALVQRDHGEMSTHAISETVRFQRPGIYRFTPAEETPHQEPVLCAVNLPAEESRTEPYPAELLVAAGLPLIPGNAALSNPVAQQAQLQHAASSLLESRQQWWRWGLVGVLAILLVETMLAAAQTYRRQQSPSAS